MRAAFAGRRIASFNDGTGTPRAPFHNRSILTPDLAGADDFVGHVFAARVLGDYTDVDATNPGWLFGTNIFTNTGPGADDGAGLEHLINLSEVSLRGSGFSGTAVGFQAEVAYMGASAGGRASSLISHKVAAPKRKDGATAGSADLVVGLWVDAVRAGDLDSDEAYSMFVAGGLSYFAGTVFVGDSFTVNENRTAKIGGATLARANDLGANVGLSVDRPLHASSFALRTDPTRRIAWGTGSPEGNIYASRGAVYLRTDTGEIYRKTSDASNTNWRLLHPASGAGSPEGAIPAPVGAIYTRTDGGAGTTLYVKESGTGNTGWVGK